ncbi:hypothetical protein [Micromonospora craniellae]|nr:hypothetical protein [Micromonospora craniellae]QOC93854.1 hypothetical protein ID554_09620 [Micromonospora craniellae]
MFFGTRLLADGWQLVHASAVSIDTDDGPRAVLFLAAPCGGKSTLAHRAGVELRAGLLADDLVLLRVSSAGIAAIGWPTRVSVPTELLDAAVRENTSGGPMVETLVRGRRRRRLVLSPPEYAAMSGVDRSGPTRLGAIVVASRTDAASATRGLAVNGNLDHKRVAAELTLAAQVPAQRLMMLDVLGVAGPCAPSPWSMRCERNDLIAGLSSGDVVTVEMSVPEMSRLPLLPVWDALSVHIPWITRIEQ